MLSLITDLRRRGSEGAIGPAFRNIAAGRGDACGLFGG
jgi:hypothetical protein